MLETNNLTKSFGGLIAVNNVSMKITKNTVCGLIGPNGAGKTTLFNILSGVIKQNSGAILFNNERIENLRPCQINKRGIARTYQNINLFNKMSVLDNVLVGMHSLFITDLTGAIFHTKKQQREEKQYKEKAIELLKMVGLEGKKDNLASSLSYGEQRILEIVRALASNPSLLLLDEPAAGMNEKEKIDLINFIKQINTNGVTILIVEHDMKVIMGLTDYIYVINFGEKIAEGSPESIQDNPKVIEAYLGGE